MVRESSQQQTAKIIAAVSLSHHKIPGSGDVFLVEAENEDEQYRLVQDIAKAVKADVTKLSNGIFLILKD